MRNQHKICSASVLFIVFLSACGGGSNSTNPGGVPDAASCETREFFNEMTGLPATYFNGHIPVSSQLPQGDITTDKVFAHDMDARRITVTETNSLTPGASTRVYTLDDQGRPLTRNERVVNSAIRLDIFLSEIRYSYDDQGLLQGYTTHPVNDEGVASDEAQASTVIEWSEVGGISQLVTTVSSGDLISQTTTYTYECTLLRTATVESEYRSQTVSPQNYTIQTAGSGKAITTTTTLEGAGVSGQRLRYDTVGNLVEVRGETINYEPTTDQVVNIVLFENAIRYRGML